MHIFRARPELQYLSSGKSSVLSQGLCHGEEGGGEDGGEREEGGRRGWREGVGETGGFPTMKGAPCLSRVASALHQIRGCQTPRNMSRASAQRGLALLARVIRSCTCAQGPRESISGSGDHLHVENVGNHSERLRELTHVRESEPGSKNISY